MAHRGLEILALACAVLLLAVLPATTSADEYVEPFTWGVEPPSPPPGETVSERMKREMMEHNMENMMAMKQLGKTGKVGALNPWHAQILVAKKAKERQLRSRVVTDQQERLVSHSFNLHLELSGLENTVSYLGGYLNEDFPQGKGLQGCGGPDGSRVWVDLRVDASISLQALHQDVLAPAMGYLRRFHAYMFIDCDSAQYGIAGTDHPGNKGGLNGPIDMMHMRYRGFELIDDRTVQLSQLLGAVGDTLVYVSDLGDLLNHTLSVSAVLPQTVTRPEILDAHGPASYADPSLIAWPVEDNDGSGGFCDGRQEEHDTDGRKPYPRNKVLARRYRGKADLLQKMRRRILDAANRRPDHTDEL